MDKFVVKSGSEAKERNDQAFKINIEKIKLYLGGLKLIKIYIPESRQFGHQGSCINILFNIVRLGFPGDFIIVCQTAKVFPKLAILLPILPNSELRPAPITIPIYGRMVNISFILLDSQQDPADLALNGGNDGSITVMSRLNCTVAIELQPYKWEKGGSENAILYQEKVTSFPKALNMPYFNNLSFYLDNPTLDAPLLAYFRNFVQWADPIAKVEIILNTNQTQNILLCPAYGINTASLNPVLTLFNLLCGISDLQIYEPRVKRKAIVPVFSPEFVPGGETIDYDLLLTFLKTGAWAKRGDVYQSNSYCAEYLTRSELSERVKVYNQQSSAGLQAAINNLGDTEILLVQIGPIPNILFKYIYSVANLPPVFEGQGTAASMLNLGKLYLHLTIASSYRDEYLTLPIESAVMGKMARYAQKVANVLTKYPSTWGNDPDEDINPNNLLGLFFRAIWFDDPDFNEVTDYFKDLGVFFHDEMNDKLYLALNYFLGVLRQK